MIMQMIILDDFSKYHWLSLIVIESVFMDSLCQIENIFNESNLEIYRGLNQYEDAILPAEEILLWR